MKKIIFVTKNILPVIVLFGFVSVAFAWNPAPPRPPRDNAPAPLNVSGSDQNKSGKLGLGGLAVFGRFQLIDGTQGAGKFLVSDAEGKASWISVTTSGNTIISPAPATSAWVNVPLNDNSPFDQSCMYRFVSDQPNPHKGTAPVVYVTQVAPESIVYILHNSLVSHINSTSKTIYRLNGADTGWKVRRIEKKC
ncbi:MAG: hypothetical protein FGM57_00295 [Candidatus Taylorbacteria bacterium]|nr:hypothetical protein [Candidatus Taylorbacteria bacterium]